MSPWLSCDLAATEGGGGWHEWKSEHFHSHPPFLTLLPLSPSSCPPTAHTPTLTSSRAEPLNTKALPLIGMQARLSLRFLLFHGCCQQIGRLGGQETAVRSGRRVGLSVACRAENTDLAEGGGLPVGNGQQEAFITGGSDVPYFLGFVRGEETFGGE